MSPSAWSKVSAKTAAEVCGLYEPSEAAQKHLRADLTPPAYVAALVQAEQYAEAIAFLAHALPKREAIWWACLSVRHAQGPQLPPKEIAALKTAVDWVVEPDEAKRRAAEAAGEAAGYRTPAGVAAFAVFGSGGSLIPAHLPVVPPAPTMTARAVSGSIKLATVKGDPKTLAAVQRELVELGVAIAEGKTVWPAGAKKR